MKWYSFKKELDNLRTADVRNCLIECNNICPGRKKNIGLLDFVFVFVFIVVVVLFFFFCLPKYFRQIQIVEHLAAALQRYTQ